MTVSDDFYRGDYDPSEWIRREEESWERERFEDMQAEARWCDDYANVTALGGWLVTEQCFNADQLQAYYEKPWKWEREFRVMQALSGETVDVVCPECGRRATVKREDVDPDGECFDECPCKGGWPRVEIETEGE